MFALKIIAVFFITVALDYVWALYTLATADRRPFVASLCAIGIYALGGMATIGYTSDHWLLIPAVLGCFVGTYIAVRKKPVVEGSPFLAKCKRLRTDGPTPCLCCPGECVGDRKEYDGHPGFFPEDVARLQ